ncbi:unnamed protein product [Rhizophagus irregularis]|nr:unnamed protein product [Rhizophagus irregularis]
MADNKFLPKLSQNLLEILNDEEYYDVTIEVGNDPYIKIFRAHIVILNYRSPHLRRILSTNEKKNDGTLTHIKLPNVSPEIFQIILRYIYGGKISLEECDPSDIIKILNAANELSLQELVTYSQTFLIENKVNWIEENINFVYQTSFENDSFLELQKYCTNLVSEEPDKVFKSSSFSSIPEKLLISLIQNDHLLMDEIQIWDHVIEWGVAQNPELSSNFTNYSKDDFKTLKNTLQHCIPFVRFYNLTSKEFMDKVLPCRKLLPKELYEELLKTFLSLSDSNSKPKNKSKPRTAKSEPKIELEEPIEVETMAIAEPIEVEVGKEGAVKICSNCDGSGVIVLLRTFGPMVQEFQQPCDTCGGEGEIIKEKDRTYKNRRPKINKFDRF